jgi:hypothetical protein
MALLDHPLKSALGNPSVPALKSPQDWVSRARTRVREESGLFGVRSQASDPGLSVGLSVGLVPR